MSLNLLIHALIHSVTHRHSEFRRIQEASHRSARSQELHYSGTLPISAWINKFFRQVNGRGQFGWVHVLAECQPAQVDIGLACDVVVTGNDFLLPLDLSYAAEWVQGALEGCREAIEYAQQGGICRGGRARILRIDGAYVDTSRESTRIAALMATWKALTDGRHLLTMTFRDDRWHVQRA